MSKNGVLWQYLGSNNPSETVFPFSLIRPVSNCIVLPGISVSTAATTVRLVGVTGFDTFRLMWVLSVPFDKDRVPS